MRSILVTGGSGYFGHWFVRKALVEGADRVCVYSRSESAQARMSEDFNQATVEFA